MIEESSHSYNESESEEKKREVSHDLPPIKVLGVYLCGKCRNVIKPLTCNGPELEFVCKNCGHQYLDYMERYDEDCTLTTHEVHRSNFSPTQRCPASTLPLPASWTRQCRDRG